VEATISQPKAHIAMARAFPGIVRMADSLLFLAVRIGVLLNANRNLSIKICSLDAVLMSDLTLC
jgi:hypothetical protein